MGKQGAWRCNVPIHSHVGWLALLWVGTLEALRIFFTPTTTMPQIYCQRKNAFTHPGSCVVALVFVSSTLHGVIDVSHFCCFNSSLFMVISILSLADMPPSIQHAREMSKYSKETQWHRCAIYDFIGMPWVPNSTGEIIMNLSSPILHCSNINATTSMGIILKAQWGPSWTLTVLVYGWRI